MDLFGLGGIVSGIADGVIGGMNYKNQKDALEFNKQAYREQMDFAKYQYEDQKRLADTAVQRRTKDLESAGFNKLMAAGGEAGSGGTVAAGGAHAEAPQLNINTGEMLDRVYNALKMNSDISMTDTQKKLIEQQIVSEQIRNDLDIANTKNIDAKTKEQLYNYNKSRNMNLRTTDTVDQRYNTAKAVAAEVTKAAAEGIKDSQKSYQRNIEAKKEYERSAGKQRRRYGYGAGTEYY